MNVKENISFIIGIFGFSVVLIFLIHGKETLFDFIFVILEGVVIILEGVVIILEGLILILGGIVILVSPIFLFGIDDFDDYGEDWKDDFDE